MVSARRSRQRRLGQNFLVDRNILDVIERASSLDPRDVVLEIGGGAGVLSERLAARVSHLHVVELDRRLERPLAGTLAVFANVSLHIEDALELELAALEPAPTKVVANLPYSVAATVILRTIEELATVTGWVVMVQREVGERLAAAPGTASYGIPSVLAQLACEVRVLRPVARTVFRPVPNVDSVLVALWRVGPGADNQLRWLVQQAFAHRRKALAGSVALASEAGAGSVGLAPGARAGLRERLRGELVALGHPPDERAERLSPEEFRELGRRLFG